MMDKCDKCNRRFKKSELTKIETDWDRTFVMVCQGCIKERGEYAIACRFDKPYTLQDESYAMRAF